MNILFSEFHKSVESSSNVFFCSMRNLSASGLVFGCYRQMIILSEFQKTVEFSLLRFSYFKKKHFFCLIGEKGAGMWQAAIMSLHFRPASHGVITDEMHMKKEDFCHAYFPTVACVGAGSTAQNTALVCVDRSSFAYSRRMNKDTQ